MGIKKTGEVTGASIILLIFFPILIAKLMANKYHKDGFLGMIKATLAGILILASLSVYNFSSLNKWSKEVDMHKYDVEQAKNSISHWSEIVNDEKKLKNYVDEYNKEYKGKYITTLEDKKASLLKYIKDKEESISQITTRLNNLFLKMATPIISIILMLLTSIILFISSSKRSRVLARAEMETTTNENHRRTEP